MKYADTPATLLRPLRAEDAAHCVVGNTVPSKMRARYGV
jgi:hypothetical protein